MIRTIVLDSNQNIKNVMLSYFKNIPDIELLGIFADFDTITVDFWSVDLVIFNINLDNSDIILSRVVNLKNKYKHLNFIATSYEINSELVSKTLKFGVREFLLKPLIPSILESAINKIRDVRNNAKPNKANTLCVFSNKGGVGKTSLVVNLAYELAQLPQNKDSNVCLLDLSFNSEDISTFLDIEQKYNIDNIVSNIENFDEKMLLSFMDRYKESNLYVLSLCQTFSFNKKYDVSTVVKIINVLKKFFSYIIIDTASVVDEINLSILNNSDMILLIAMMNLASVRNSQKCFELFENIKINKEKIKLVVNRYIENTQVSIRDIEKTLNHEVFFKVPNNYLTLIDAINQGQALGEINPQSNIAKAYKNLAVEISNVDFMSLNDANPKTYDHGVFNLLRRMGE